jgi:hypothetical protein
MALAAAVWPDALADGIDEAGPPVVVGPAVVVEPAVVVDAAVVAGTAAVSGGVTIDPVPAVDLLVVGAVREMALLPHAPARAAMASKATT